MNVLFFLVDCLRADVCYGEGRTVRTPTLDSLTSRGIVFTQAVSVAGNTPVCLASIFTGVYPFCHGIRPISLNRFHLSAGKLNGSYRTIGEILQGNGYGTYATITGPPLHTTGLDRGFDEYVYREGEQTYLSGKFSGDLKRTLQRLYGSEKPWFFFAHLWEIHAPRQVLSGFRSSQYGRNRYERAVSSLDHELGQILEDVDLDNTLVIIHGDHGEGTESLFEFLLHPQLHDLIGVKISRLFYRLFYKWIHRYRSLQSAHGLNLYDYILRVPLIVAGPGIPHNRVVEDQVSQIDILPTLAEFLRVPEDLGSFIHGRSLCPLIAGQPLSERPVYSEAYSGKSMSFSSVPIWRGAAETFLKPPALVSIRTPEWKCIWVPDDPKIPTELYHLARDPSERVNLYVPGSEVAVEMKAHLSHLESSAPSDGPTGEMSEEEQAILERRLRELGYL